MSSLNLYSWQSPLEKDNPNETHHNQCSWILELNPDRNSARWSIQWVSCNILNPQNNILSVYSLYCHYKIVILLVECYTFRKQFVQVEDRIHLIFPTAQFYKSYHSTRSARRQRTRTIKSSSDTISIPCQNIPLSTIDPDSCADVMLLMCCINTDSPYVILLSWSLYLLVTMSESIYWFPSRQVKKRARLLLPSSVGVEWTGHYTD